GLLALLRLGLRRRTGCSICRSTQFTFHFFTFYFLFPSVAFVWRAPFPFQRHWTRTRYLRRLSKSAHRLSDGNWRHPAAFCTRSLSRFWLSLCSFAFCRAGHAPRTHVPMERTGSGARLDPCFASDAYGLVGASAHTQSPGKLSHRFHAGLCRRCALASAFAPIIMVESNI